MSRIRLMISTLTIGILFLFNTAVYAQDGGLQITLIRDEEYFSLYAWSGSAGLLENMRIQVEGPRGTITRSLGEYVSFRLPFNSLPTPVCFHVERSGSNVPIPFECQNLGQFTFTQRISDADVFWYDDVSNLSIPVMILDGDTPVGFCGADAPRCEITIGRNRAADASLAVFESLRDGNSEIYSIDIRSAIETRLTNANGFDGDPAFSADRTKIVFVSDRNGHRDLFVMNIDGNGVQQLTNDAIVKSDPVWSSDGSHIAYTGSDNGATDIYVFDVDAGRARQLIGHGADDEQPSWSPDGRQIVFVSNRTGERQLYIADDSGSDVQQIGDLAGENFAPAWAPDMNRIVYTSTHDGNPELYVYNISRGSSSPLTVNAANDTSATRSADGSEILFVSERDGVSNLYLIDIDGGVDQEAQRVTNSRAEDIAPSWGG